MLRMSHAIVSARYSAKIQVRCVAVWITFPLCGSGSRLVANIWKQYPSKSRSICLLSPASGIVSRANGQVRGKCTNSCSFSCPFSNWTPGASSLVTPLEYRVRSMLYSPSARSRKASYAVSNLSWSEATDEASKLVHSESVEELSGTPDQPLSASDPLSSLATMSRSTLLLSADAFLSTGMRLGVSENLFPCKCSRWVSSATWQEGMPNAWHAAARQGLCGWRQKASKKCSIPTGAMKEHLSSRTQSPFQASMHQKDCSTVRVGQRM